MLSIIFLCLWIIPLIISVPTNPPLEFQLITSNVRVDTTNRYPHEKAWSERKYGQIEVLHNFSSILPTLIGLQEVKINQLTDVINGLNNYTNVNYTYFGVGRDDGKQSGEYAALVYNTNEWELINGTYKWLSPTPNVPSKAWGASNIRIVTMTEMKHKESGVIINFWNTHFDDASEEARGNSSILISRWLNEIPNNYQTYLTGDFNSQSTDVSYQNIEKVLADTRITAQQKLSLDNTYTGFEPTDTGSVIDFIWTPLNPNQAESPNQVLFYNIVSSWTPEGFRFSDHQPVIATIKLQS